VAETDRVGIILHSPRLGSSVTAKPALLTGTSSEYLGKRALPRILSERSSVVVLGPEGSGKTSVALRLAEPSPLRLDTKAVQDALVECIAARKWRKELLEAPAVVLDGPVWLRGRPGAVAAICQLLKERQKASRRTIVCQSDSDGSVEELIAAMEPGSLVVVGLRFPKGERGRQRFARRQCEVLELSKSLAKDTHNIEPWGYDRVIAYLKAQKRAANS